MHGSGLKQMSVRNLNSKADVTNNKVCEEVFPHWTLFFKKSMIL